MDVEGLNRLWWTTDLGEEAAQQAGVFAGRALGRSDRTSRPGTRLPPSRLADRPLAGSPSETSSGLAAARVTLLEIAYCSLMPGALH